MDKNSELAKTTPHAFIFDKNKKLVYKGAIDNAVETKKTELDTYLYDAIRSIVAGTEITESSTPPGGCSIKRVKK